MIGFLSYNNTNNNLILNKHKNILPVTLENIYKYFSDKEEIAFDSETKGFDPYQDDIICIQIGDRQHQFVIDITSVDIQLFKSLLESKTLIGHNLKFDLKFLYHHRIVPIRVFDTFLAEKTTKLGISLHRSSLKDAVYRHIGVYLDKTERQNINGNYSVPFVIYAAKDVEYLHELKEKQLKILEEQKSLTSIELDNRFVKVLAYIEYCGIKLDEGKWRAKMAKTNLALKQAEEQLNQFIKDNKLSKFYSSQVDLFNPQQARMTINWNSVQQVIQFFKTIGVDTSIVDKGETKDTVEAGHLIKFVDRFPIIKTYLEYKQAQKDLGTYGENFIKLINPISGRIHTQYKQLMNTGRLSSGGKDKATGAAYPNLQNIPSDEETRSCFVAEEGNVIIGCDYSGRRKKLYNHIEYCPQ